MRNGFTLTGEEKERSAEERSPTSALTEGEGEEED